MPFDQQGYARDTAESTATEKTPGAAEAFAAVFLLLVIWGTCVALWGLPGLYLPAVAATPVMMLTILRITLG